MTQDHFELAVQSRTVLGKKVKSLRKQGYLPANIFGEVDKPFSISIKTKEFISLSKQASDTSIVYLQVEGEKSTRPTLIDAVDTDALTGQLLHVSFRQVNLNEAVTAEVPVELVGELTITESTPVLLREEIEVEALPTDLPESFTIDLAQFTEIGQEVMVKDLKFDRAKVKLMNVEDDEVILQIQKVEQMAEVVDETPASVEEVETTEQGKADETPAEGEKATENKEEEKK